MGGETSPYWGWATRSRASVVDDFTRLACSEVLPDEKAPTVVGFAIRALEFYRECGITHVEEVMTDNHPHSPLKPEEPSNFPPGGENGGGSAGPARRARRGERGRGRGDGRAARGGRRGEAGRRGGEGSGII